MACKNTDWLLSDLKMGWYEFTTGELIAERQVTYNCMFPSDDYLFLVKCTLSQYRFNSVQACDTS